MLVTHLDPAAFPATLIPKHYCDRGDAENGFDELKNQYGWGAATPRVHSPPATLMAYLMAYLIALLHNWRNLYLRFYDEGYHRKPIQTQPMLMAGVGILGK